MPRIERISVRVYFRCLRLEIMNKNFERRPPRLQPYWPVFWRIMPFFRLLLAITAHFPCLLGEPRSSLSYSGTFHAAIIVRDGECEWPDGFCGTGQAAVDTFEAKSPLEPPPWGRLLRRTRENAVILARTVSAPLGWRRKERSKENPPVGSAAWP